ncbi:MAG: arylamine N-acetyltransferase [Burkholderiales bacterium]|nr:arylamine N-acetyltransferase [Burkholderiales bacterium]
MIFDLPAYFARIGYAGNPRPDAQTLEALHLAHATHIPFENLDILLGRPIRLDLESIQAKLVGGARGGYCYEHNLLLAVALEAIGFRVTRLAARVRYRTRRALPRTHMLLKVEVEGADWIADAGFGFSGPLLPLPLTPGRESTQYRWSYRLVLDAGPWTLQTRGAGEWEDLYAFSLEPQEQADFEMANYYVSTHPESRFLATVVAQASTTALRRMLRGLELTEDDGAAVSTRLLAGEAELLQVLAADFGIRLPAGMRLPFARADRRVEPGAPPVPPPAAQPTST